MAASDRCKPKLFTLVLVTDGSRVLLGKKKRGFAEGYFNGFGGKARSRFRCGAVDVTRLESKLEALLAARASSTWSTEQVEAGETIREAASRELFEEAGIAADSMTHRGVLTFLFDDRPQPWEVHVFHASRYTGVPTESDEMAPQWFPFDSIPYQQMWADDVHWYPLLLKGTACFRGTFHFVDTHVLVKHELRQVPDLATG